MCLLALASFFNLDYCVCCLVKLCKQRKKIKDGRTWKDLEDFIWLLVMTRVLWIKFSNTKA